MLPRHHFGTSLVLLSGDLMRLPCALRYGTPFLKADYHIKIKTTETSLVVKLTFKSTYSKTTKKIIANIIFFSQNTHRILTF